MSKPDLQTVKAWGLKHKTTGKIIPEAYMFKRDAVKFKYGLRSYKVIAVKISEIRNAAEA